MGSFSIWHWIIVFMIIAVLFGTKKLRTLGQDLGTAVKNFKTALHDTNQNSDGPNADGLQEKPGSSHADA
jgi:sec-independent protein translocase protein TatA